MTMSHPTSENQEKVKFLLLLTQGLVALHPSVYHLHPSNYISFLSALMFWDYFLHKNGYNSSKYTSNSTFLIKFLDQWCYTFSECYMINVSPDLPFFSIFVLETLKFKKKWLYSHWLSSQPWIESHVCLN